MFRHIRWLVAMLLIISLLSPAGGAYARYMFESDEAGTQAMDIDYRPGLKAAAPAVPEPVTYVVSRGDTLYKIANSFGSTVADLQAYNQLSNPNTLQIGQKLTIPSVPAEVPLLEGKEAVIERVLSTTLTAYTAGKESTGKTPSHPQYGITYSGVKAEEGRTVAVDPKVIPLGSTVYIEGIGIRKAEDTGSAIKGSKIDVFMNDVGEARTFGVKRNVKVFVLAAA
jgi:3D (Asp-Asp-Asp) domain-containing protein